MAGVMLDADGAVSGIKEDRAIVQLHRDDFLNSKVIMTIPNDTSTVFTFSKIFLVITLMFYSSSRVQDKWNSTVNEVQVGMKRSSKTF